MNDDYPFPLISAHNYEGFCQLIKDDFPQSYEQWLGLVTKRRIEESQRGYRFVEVDVNPDEFARYCAETGQYCNSAALGRFATEKHGGSNY